MPSCQGASSVWRPCHAPNHARVATQRSSQTPLHWPVGDQLPYSNTPVSARGHDFLTIRRPRCYPDRWEVPSFSSRHEGVLFRRSRRRHEFSLQVAHKSILITICSDTNRHIANMASPRIYTAAEKIKPMSLLGCKTYTKDCIAVIGCVKFVGEAIGCQVKSRS